MKLIKNFFKEFDVFAAPATLRARLEPEVASLCLGIVSFCVTILFAAVICFKIS